MVFKKLRQHANAYKQYESALHIAVKLQNLPRQMHCHELMAYAIIDQHPLNIKRVSFEEEKHWVQLLSLAERTNSLAQHAEAHGNIGVIREGLGHIDEDEARYDKAIDIYTSIGHERAEVWDIFLEDLLKKRSDNSI